MMTVIELINELKKYNDGDIVTVIALAETSKMVTEGDSFDMDIFFVFDGCYVDDHKEPTIFVSLFNDEALEEIENGTKNKFLLNRRK